MQARGLPCKQPTQLQSGAPWMASWAPPGVMHEDRASHKSWASPGVMHEGRASHKSWAPPGVAQKLKQKQIFTWPIHQMERKININMNTFQLCYTSALPQSTKKRISWQRACGEGLRRRPYMPREAEATQMSASTLWFHKLGLLQIFLPQMSGIKRLPLPNFFYCNSSQAPNFLFSFEF